MSIFEMFVTQLPLPFWAINTGMYIPETPQRHQQHDVVDDRYPWWWSATT